MLHWGAQSEINTHMSPSKPSVFQCMQRWSIVFLSLLFKLWAVKATKVSASMVEKGAEKSQCSSLSASMFLTVTVQNGKNNKNKQAVMWIQGVCFSMGNIQTWALTFPQHYTEKETWGAHLRLKTPPFSKDIMMCIECLRTLNLERKKGQRDERKQQINS